MKIGIIDAELIYSKKHRFPNLASMKLSAYHKNKGDNVSLLLTYDDIEKFDKVYISKVFTETQVPKKVLAFSNVEYGGTGFFYDKAPPLPYEIEPLLKYISKDKVIWCPCDEYWSAFVRLFTEKGYKVIYSSIKSGQNFLTYEPDVHYDIIVTNLPFSKKDKMLKRLDELKKPFAVLLPMNSLQGIKRFEVFKNGIQILSFDRRIDYHTNNDFAKFKKGNHFASAYFCRDVLPKDLIIEELKQYDRPILKGEI